MLRDLHRRQLVRFSWRLKKEQDGTLLGGESSEEDLQLPGWVGAGVGAGLDRLHVIAEKRGNASYVCWEPGGVDRVDSTPGLALWGLWL